VKEKVQKIQNEIQHLEKEKVKANVTKVNAEKKIEKAKKEKTVLSVGEVKKEREV